MLKVLKISIILLTICSTSRASDDPSVYTNIHIPKPMYIPKGTVLTQDTWGFDAPGIKRVILIDVRYNALIGLYGNEISLGSIWQQRHGLSIEREKFTGKRLLFSQIENWTHRAAWLAILVKVVSSEFK